MCIYQHFTFTTLSYAIFCYRLFTFPLNIFINFTFKGTICRHHLCSLLTPKFEYILNYSFIFPYPYSITPQRIFYKHPNLHNYYLTIPTPGPWCSKTISLYYDGSKRLYT